MQGIAKTEDAEKERRRRISITMSKKVKSEEHKRKIMKTSNREDIKKRKSNAMLIKWQDNKFIQKMMERRKRQWTMGDRNIAKQTLKNKWKNDSFRKYMINCRKTPYSDIKYRKKLSDARLKQTFPMRDTSIEIKLQNALKNENTIFTTHQSILGQPDIFIKPHICIFCDGDYWHNRKDYKKRDKIVNKKLKEKGYIILRFWEHQINNNISECIEIIKNVILENGDCVRPTETKATVCETGTILRGDTIGSPHHL